MKKYRKKPVVIEAHCYNGGNHEEIFNWAKEYNVTVICKRGSDEITIPTLEGDHKAKPGDYVVKGVKGEFYPCKPDIFEMTYEVVEE